MNLASVGFGVAQEGLPLQLCQFQLVQRVIGLGSWHQERHASKRSAGRKTEGQEVREKPTGRWRCFPPHRRPSAPCSSLSAA